MVSPMPVLPAATARAVLTGLAAVGLDAEALRRAAGIDDEELERPDGILPGEAFPRLWEEAFRRAPCEELPTEVGLAIPFGAFGALDYLAGSSPTVEAAFHSLQGHFRQVAQLGLEIVRSPASADVRLHVPAPFPGREVSDEMTIAILVGRFRGDTAGPFRASAVRLTRAPPARPTRHAELLGAPVAFGCSTAGLEVPLAAWTAPMRRADPALQATLRHLASRLDLGPGGDDLEMALRARLRTLLPDGTADAATVGRTLGLSQRTLHRRLRELGRTYRGVLDAFREAEAERLLASGRASLSDVAFRLGFSDQTAWNRAFRRWKGLSPTEWLQARAPPKGASPRR
jgi:AraC-like DNA-binding protein